MKKRILICSMAMAATFGVTRVHAQADAAQMMRGGVEDCNTLMNAYMSPMMKAFGAGLNGGWFQTAKPHGIGGFDVTFSLNIANAPTADQSYTPSSLGFKKLQLGAGSEDKAPTIFGDAKEGPSVELPVTVQIPDYANPGNTKDTTLIASRFNLPQGGGVPSFPTPTIQASVGIGFGTEIGIRYLPTMKSTDYEVGMFGFAVKHDIKQWIPGIKLMPFDLSAMFGYTRFNAMFKFTDALKPDTAGQSATVFYASGLPAWDNQKMEFVASGWTLNVLLSKKLGPITPYIGLGYQRSSVTFDMKGDYPINTPNSNATTVGDPSFGKAMRVESFSNPIHIDGSLSGFRTTVGMRLKILLLTFHADYTIAEYNVISAGLGLNLQSIVPFKL